MNVNYVPRRRLGSDSYQPISVPSIRPIPEALGRYLTHCLRVCSYHRNDYSTNPTILMYAPRGFGEPFAASLGVSSNPRVP
jgi:hypothetical protein